MPVRAATITIGSELVLGKIVDTNAAWLARELTAQGVTVAAHLALPDDVDAIAEALSDAREQFDLVVLTGGLGPTPDDLTRDAITAAFGVEFILDEPAWADFCDARDRPVPESNAAQFLVPAAALDEHDPHAAVIENPVGVAHGFALWDEPEEDELVPPLLIALPGVPREMKTMFTEHVAPLLRDQLPLAPMKQRRLRCAGLWESALAERLDDLLTPGRDPMSGILASAEHLEVWFAASGDDADARLDADVAEVRRRLGPVVFGEDDDTLADALVRLVRAHGLTLAVAESCTGGRIAERLTSIPGVSDVFLEAVVTYSDAAKTTRLGVPESLLAEHGAVSEAVAAAMAEGMVRSSGATFGLATTGIAGPTGGTPDKPVGLVYVAAHRANTGKTHVRRLLLRGDRDLIRSRATAAALNLGRLLLLDALDAPNDAPAPR